VNSLKLGFLGMIAVIVMAISGGNVKALLNVHSMIIVVLGTVCVFAIASPFKSIKSVMRALRSMKRIEKEDFSIDQALIGLSKSKANTDVKDSHPLIEYAFTLWEQGVDHDTTSELLTQKLEELNADSKDVVITLKNLAKYPPALGMTGTVIGMVSLFSNLNAENRANIGPNIAFAMTATFYGLILANALIMPLADRLLVSHQVKLKINEKVYRIIMLIHEDKPKTLIEDEVNAKAA
jgi:chemotaxis protein MotA